MPIREDGGAVDHQARLQSSVLLIARHIAQLGLGLQFAKKRGTQLVQLSHVGVFQAVLKLGPADAVLHRQILDGLHVKRDALLAASCGCSLRMMSLALIPRSSIGFRLTRMRPLLTVVLVPSMPMKEDRLSTAGSLRMTFVRLVAARPWS